MRITVKGITPSTIAFNTLGIVIRGNSNNLDSYPGSIAKHIDIVNEDQLSELNAMVNAKLIQVEIEDTNENDKIHPDQLSSVIKPKEKTAKKSSKDKPKKKTSSNSKKRGRPKGSKNKKSSKKITKANDMKNGDEIEDSSAIVMTPSGAKQGKMKRTAAGEIDESEKTKASLEAMKKLEEEEALDRNLPDDKADESEFDLSEKTGQEAVISSNGNAQKVKMQQSIVPESKAIKEREIGFIDSDDKKDEAIKQAFVDQDSDDSNDAFLES